MYIVIQYNIQNELSETHIIKYDTYTHKFYTHTREVQNNITSNYSQEYPYIDKESMILTLLRHLPPIYGSDSEKADEFYIYEENAFKYVLITYACLYDNTPVMYDSYKLYMKKRRTIDNKIISLLDILTLDEKFESTPAYSKGQQLLNDDDSK